MPRSRKLALFPFILSLLAMTLVAAEGGVTLKVRLRITTPLSYTNTPLDPAFNFSELIKQAGASGFFDPNSIKVINLVTGEHVSHAPSIPVRTNNFRKAIGTITCCRHESWIT